MDEFIEALRKKKEQIGAVKMARTIGIHHSALYRILNEKRGMRTDTLKKILAAYPDLSPDLAALFLPNNSPICEIPSQLGKSASPDTTPIST